MANKYMERSSTTDVIKETQIKQQDTITHLLEQPKYKHQILTKDVEPDNLTFILLSQFTVGGNVKWHSHFER